MSLTTTHKEIQFGVGDKIRVHQKIKEGDKERTQIFEGMVIGISNRENGKTVTVRRIGEAGVGIERIFPLASPLIEKIEQVKKGTAAVRHAKLYFTREKAPRQVEEIYTKTAKRDILPAKRARKKKK